MISSREDNSCHVLMLPSRAIRHFLFHTYEVVITSLSYSSAFMSEIIKCSIPLVDNNINIHRAIYFGQIHAYVTASKTYNMLQMIVHKSSLFYATRLRDVTLTLLVVVRTALTAAMVVPSTMFKMYDPPNSETQVEKLLPNFPRNKYDLRGRSRPISVKETRIYDSTDST